MKSSVMVASVLVILSIVQMVQFLPRSNGDLIDEVSISPHGPIVIDGDEDFTTENGVTSGSGTEDDPFVIANFSIPVVEVGIKIINTQAHFEIVNCEMTGRWSNDVEHAIILDQGICIGSPNGSVRSCRISNNHIGINVTGLGLEIVDNLIQKNEYCIKMEVIRSNISNNIFRNYLHCGILSSNSDTISISDNICQYQLNRYIEAQGITLLKTNGSTIIHNIITGTNKGMCIINSSRNHIISNFIRTNDTRVDIGMFLENSYYNHISDNQFVECGFIIGGDNPASYISNQIDSSNIIDDLPIIFVKNSSKIIVKDHRMGALIISNCSEVDIFDMDFIDVFMSITITYSKSVRIHNITLQATNNGIIMQNVNNMIIDNSSLSLTGSYGLIMENCVNMIISKNKIEGLDIGIIGDGLLNSTIEFNEFNLNNRNVGLGIPCVNECNGNRILNNSFYNGWYGISINGNNNLIEGNVIHSMKESGIEIDLLNNTVKDNEISNSLNAIRTRRGNSLAKINNNNLFFNRIGIMIDTLVDGRSEIRNNKIILNDGYGIKMIKMVDSIENRPEFTISNNSFIGNNKGYGGIQAFDPFGISKWNDSEGVGNYWSDYRDRYVPPAIENGTSWSIPYSIDGGAGNVDHYPLTIDPNRRVNLLILSKSNQLNAYVCIDYSMTYDVVYLKEGEVEWTFRTNASWLTFNEDHLLYGRPDYNDIGSYWVNISVSDGSLSDETNFTIIVTYKNFRPIIMTDDQLIIDQWHHYQVDYEATDQQMDLEWRLITKARFLSINGTTGILSGDPGLNDVGTFQVNVSVNDGELFDVHEFDLTVNDVNDPPMMNSSFEHLYVNEDWSLTLIISEVFFNYDNDRIIVRWINTSGNVSWSIDGNSITLSPVSDYHGTDIVEFTVEDGHYSKCFVTYLVVRPENDAPRGLSMYLTKGRFLKGDFLIFSANFSDPDSFDLTVTWYVDGSVVGYGPVLNLSLPAGTFNLTLRVTDTSGAFAEISQTIHIEANGEVHPEGQGKIVLVLSIASIVIVLILIVIATFFLKRKWKGQVLEPIPDKVAMSNPSMTKGRPWLPLRMSDHPVKYGPLDEEGLPGAPSLYEGIPEPSIHCPGIPREDIPSLRRRLNIMYDNRELSSEEHRRVIDLLDVIEE